MISPSGNGAGHRRRSLDAEVNLVPFIDLLSMCICFLLMTAVWMQVGSLQVKQARGTEAAQTPAAGLEADLRFASSTRLELSLTRSGKVLKKLSIAASSPEALLAEFDSSLTRTLEMLGRPQVASAMLTPRSGVAYGQLVGVMDVLRRHQILSLGVVPVGGAS